MYRRPLPFLESLPALGDVVRIRIAAESMALVCTPELTQHVLRHDRVHDKGGAFFERGHETFGNSVVICPHAEHRRQRRLCQPAFGAGHLAHYGTIMTEEIARVVEPWRPGVPIDVLAAMYTMSSRVLVRSVFGTDISPVDQADCLADMHTVLSGMYRRVLAPGWVNALPTKGNRRYDRAGRRLRATITRVAADRRHTDRDGDDLISALLSARDDDAPGADRFSDPEIVDQVVTFFVGGTESTANTVAWALHLVAGDPEVEAALHAEVDGVLTDATATFADLPHLPVTERVIMETLRMYPPVWFLTRRVTEPCVLGGFALPAGATVALSPYLLHHLPDVFPEPHRFRPDRWRTGSANTRPTGAFLPFGAGRRKCIGDNFGFNEARIALATVAARWRLRPVPGTRPRPGIAALMAPRDLHLHATPRSA